jgi:hypothetical protein
VIFLILAAYRSCSDVHQQVDAVFFDHGVLTQVTAANKGVGPDEADFSFSEANGAIWNVAYA